MLSVLLLGFFCVFFKGLGSVFLRMVGFYFCPFLVYRFGAPVCLGFPKLFLFWLYIAFLLIKKRYIPHFSICL